MKATANTYEIIHADTRYCILQILAVVLFPSESRAIINDLDVMLHGLVLLVIYSTVSPFASLRVRLFDVVYILLGYGYASLEVTRLLQ